MSCCDVFSQESRVPLNVDRLKNLLCNKISRSSHRRCSVKKGVLKNFAKVTEKHLCWRSLSFIKRLQYKCFPVKFENFLEQLF